LTRQVERLQHVARERGYQVVALISEQASSLNEKRKGMQRLLTLIDQHAIDVVLIEYPDRLVHFGFGYLEEAFGWKQVRLEVVEPPKAQTPTEELVADVLSMMTVFSGRLYGSRANNIRSCVSHAFKDCLKRDAEETDGTGCENHQTPAGSL
jgi:putative resolvase